MFKSEYKFYPDFGANATGDSYTVSLNSPRAPRHLLKHYLRELQLARLFPLPMPKA